MKVRLFVILTSVFCLALGVAGARRFAARQQASSAQPVAANPTSAHLDRPADTPDALEFQRLIVRNAPFSATLVIETTLPQQDGSTATKTSTSILYRDRKGRTRRDLVEQQSAADATTPRSSVINDPVTGFSFALDHPRASARRTAFVYQPTEAPAENSRQSDQTVARQHLLPMPSVSGGENNGLRAGNADNTSAPKTESIGVREIEGVLAEGTRVTVTVPAAVQGNDKPMEIVAERWYSPALQTVVLMKRTEPRGGETVYKLIDIKPGEPAAQLFVVPVEYKVRDESGREVSAGKK